MSQTDNMYVAASKIGDVEANIELKSPKNFTTDGKMKSREPKTFKWSNVNFSAMLPNGSEKSILTDCWGAVPAGKVYLCFSDTDLGISISITPSSNTIYPFSYHRCVLSWVLRAQENHPY